jgi:hypothetical protein
MGIFLDYLFTACVICLIGLATFRLITIGNNRPTVTEAVIASALGLLVAGMVYCVLASLGINGEYLTAILFMLFATYNLIRFGKSCFPTASLIAQNNIGHLVSSVAAFLIFGGYTVIGMLRMGAGEFPEIFFNYDAPLRLAHAQQLVDFRGPYPPESLYTAGIRYSYHFGASAAAAFLTTLTSLPVHKALFHIVSPLMICASFCCIYIFAKQFFKSVYITIALTTLFSPSLYYLPEIIQLSSDGLGSVIPSYYKLLQDSIGLPTYNPEHLGKGVGDPAVNAARFLGLFSLLILIRPTSVRLLASAIILLPISIFTKANVLSAIGTTYLSKGLILIRHKTVLTVLVTVVTIAAIVGIIFFQGYGDDQFAGSSIAVQGNTKLADLSQVLIRSLSRLLFTPYYFSITAAAGVLIYIGLSTNKIAAVESGHTSMILNIFTWIFLYSVVTILIVEIVSANQIGSLSSWRWMITPMLALILIAVGRNTGRAVQTVTALVLIPVFAISIASSISRLNHLKIIIHSPLESHEVLDNREIGPALRSIPKNDTLLVTNQLTHPSFWLTNPSISALFGHKAYSAYYDGPVKIGKKEALTQLILLSSRFRKSNSAFSRDVKARAQHEGWTHFLFHKSSDLINDYYNKESDYLLPPRTVDDIPLKIIFENREYAVFEF